MKATPTLEVTILVAAVGLGLLQIMLAAQAANMQRGYRWGASARDAPAAALTGIAGRLTRASANFAETFPFFAVAVLLARQQGVSDHVTVYAAATYLAARLLYLILCALGTFFWRSMIWNVATLSIVTIFVEVILKS